MTVEQDYRQIHSVIDEHLARNATEVASALHPTDVGLIQDRFVSHVDSDIRVGVLEVPTTLSVKSPALDLMKVAWYASATRTGRQIWLPEWGVMTSHTRPILAINNSSPVLGWQQNQKLVHKDGWPSKVEETKLRAELFALLKAVGAMALTEEDIQALSNSNS